MILLGLSQWIAVKDGDADAFELMKRHYSYKPYRDGRREDKNNPNRKLFVGPGEKMVLMTPDGLALFVWRKFKNEARPEGGVNCAVFRNEGSALSSRLILGAEELAWERWPGETLYTYVNARKIGSSNPGYCFLKAGWVRLKERTKHNRLVILEKRP